MKRYFIGNKVHTDKELYELIGRNKQDINKGKPVLCISYDDKNKIYCLFHSNDGYSKLIYRPKYNEITIEPTTARKEFDKIDEGYFDKFVLYDKQICINTTIKDILSYHMGIERQNRKQTKNYVTRRKLIRMFNWFMNKGKTVRIVNYYNNSLGVNCERCYVGKITDFIITTSDCAYVKEYDMKFALENGSYSEYSHDKNIKNMSLDSKIFNEEHIDSESYFTGLGEIEWCNSGPMCGFAIKIIKEE